ncbi:unnamed protein product [marine sediment metagenome]|uniref:Uncharacterized protein n=1 Tax=marine sediment metagenome TaxID=412755 RepID=X1BII6_9ZZZZ
MYNFNYPTEVVRLFISELMVRMCSECWLIYELPQAVPNVKIFYSQGLLLTGDLIYRANKAAIYKKGFKMEIKQWQKEIYELAVEKGWWDRERPIPELLCLIHSEVSEALEAYRDGYQEDMAGELADVAIRLFEMAFKAAP